MADMKEKTDWKAYYLSKRGEAQGEFSLRGSLASMLAQRGEDGTSLGEALMEAYIGDRLEHPERLSLKEISAALGESRQNVDVTSGGEPLDFFAPPKGDDEG